MNYYESIFILNPDLSSEQSEQIKETLSGVVEKNGGKLHIVDDWGVKRLAYEVKKHPKGRYVLIQFAAEPGVARELERNYRVNDGVIKYLTSRIQEKDLKLVKPKAPEEASQTGQDQTGE